MFTQDAIARLYEIGEQQYRELLGSSPARTAGSEPVGEVAATSTPASTDAVSSGEQTSL
jgi:hypothetical protein